MTSLRPSFLALGLAAPALGLALFVAPQTAEACGGTFCDNLPQPMPVDQTGEDILFVMDGTSVEVSVRIQYTGEAERFAWVLPLQGIPEISVGSDPLFTALSGTLAPNWYTQTQYDCDEDNPWGGEQAEAEGDGGDGVKLDLGDDGPPEVVFEEVVGAFEIVVLQGGTAAEVIDFLEQNNYAQDPAAEPILQEYLDEGFLFAAVKLAAGAEVEQIHPLTFKFQGDEPCVPIRLTRIAAEEDMGIRAYFLAQDRWAPSSYEHVVLNPLAYDWQAPSTQGYLELLSLAVDEAGGHAFATEYAGPSDVVPTANVFRDTWDETAFIGVDPIAAIDLIAQQGLAVHPLIRSLLMEFIPPPDGLTPQEFWNNIAQYADQIDLDAWDDVAFAAALGERIIEPGLHAVELLETWPKLTRLNTTISPNEMTYDPMFIGNADLPDVDNTQVATLEQVLCGGDQRFHVDLEGTDTPVCVPEGLAYPLDFPVWEAMPYNLRVEQIPAMGPPQVTVDNSEAIASAYDAYQASVECLADAAGETTGDDASETGTGTGGAYDLPYNVTCGCVTERDSAPLGLALGLLALALIRPRRRRE